MRTLKLTVLAVAFLLSLMFKVNYAAENLIKLNRTLWPSNFVEAIVHSNAMQNVYQNMKQSKMDTLSDFNLDGFLKDVLANIESSEGLNLPNFTQDCLTELLALASGLSARQQWALSVIDAFGKPTSGILRGYFALRRNRRSTSWLGEYSECVETKQDTFNGKYCTLGKPLPPGLQVTVSLKLGICVPDTCNNEDIASLVNFAISNLPENITNLLPIQISPINSTFVTCQEPKVLDSPASLAIAIYSIIIAIVALGTLYDFYKLAVVYFQKYYILNGPITIVQNHVETLVNTDEKDSLIKKYQDENEPLIFKILLSFSAYSNALKVFKITKNDDQLQSLNAIRFLSIAWVILGHCYIFGLSFADNQAVLLSWIKRFSFLIVSNAYFSVDTFFLISGLLTSYIFLKEVNKNQKGDKLTINLMFKYYIHRLWRITPPYALVLMFSATLSKYLGSGPVYPAEGFEINQCRDTWWTNLLYINNLVKPNQQCVAVTWYLANDMQFHWIAPIVLIPFAFGKTLIGVSISILILVANILATSFVLNSEPGMEVGILSFGPQTQDYFSKIYITPWSRIGPYVIGLLLGYYLTIRKKSTNNKIRSELNIFFWVVSLVILGLMLFGIYPDFNGNPLGRVTHILYQSTSRIMWAIGLSYIIYSCTFSQGGFINKILSWHIWVPLSRISFSTYLIHSSVIFYYYYTQEHMLHFQDINMIVRFLGILVLSNAAGFVVSILFEIPLIGLEKFIFSRH